MILLGTEIEVVVVLTRIIVDLIIDPDVLGQDQGLCAIIVSLTEKGIETPDLPHVTVLVNDPRLHSISRSRSPSSVQSIHGRTPEPSAKTAMDYGNNEDFLSAIIDELETDDQVGQGVSEKGKEIVEKAINLSKLQFATKANNYLRPKNLPGLFTH